MVLPVKQICALARSKGILSAVDGAHVPGMMRFNLHDLGCDMYSSSPHKWLQAPKGSGFLYVREGRVQDRLWNTIVTDGWNDPKLKAERFQRIGSSNVPALHGLACIDQTRERHSLERIEKRHRQWRLHAGRDHQARVVGGHPRSSIAVRHHNQTFRQFRGWIWRAAVDKRQNRIAAASCPTQALDSLLLGEADIDRYLAVFDEYKKVN